MCASPGLAESRALAYPHAGSAPLTTQTCARAKRLTLRPRGCYDLRMNKPHRLILQSVLLIVTAALVAGAEESHGEWRSLFNGKDLSGWKIVGNAAWRVEDGVIVGTQDGDASRSGLLNTAEQFKDFEITLDFFLDEHGKYNSGVYLRNDPKARGQTGYQINIGRGAVGEYCGGVYKDGWRATGDEKDAIRKPLAWNTLVIRAQGAHIEVELNGKKVVDYTDLKPTEQLLGKGVISLQTYGAEGHAGFVKFRNIKIRELEAASKSKQ
jgi:3-keto-disaccharide hydrolase